MVRLSIAIVLLVSGAARADSECASPNTCRPACAKGDASACTWLGEFYTGHVAAQDTTMYSSVGIKLLDGACSKGIGEACHELSGALTVVAALASRTPDMKRFRELRTKACKLGYGDDCDDPKQQLAAYEKACTAGDPAGCSKASHAYGYDTDDDSSQGDASGGTGTAMALDEGTMGMKSEPAVAADPKKGRALAERAMNLLADACAHGKARTCSGAKLREYQRRRPDACRVGSSSACHELASDAMVTGLPWIDSAARACELGDFFACSDVAGAYESGSFGVKADAAKALQLVSKGCDLHDGAACTRLAQKADPAKALAWFQRACDENEIFGCEQVGDALATGTHGATKNVGKAIELFGKACELQYRTSADSRSICAELAARYDTGDGVAKDPARAKTLRQQGCDRGEKC